MAEAPQFFVPGVGADEQEAAYAEFARACARPVPLMTGRIYSIVYIHDGEEWTATVGETLRGIKRRTTRSTDRKVVRKFWLSDAATVLAIFEGYPYVVMTNKGAGIRSAWANPFFVGRPSEVKYFSP